MKLNRKIICALLSCTMLLGYYASGLYVTADDGEISGNDIAVEETVETEETAEITEQAEETTEITEQTEETAEITETTEETTETSAETMVAETTETSKLTEETTTTETTEASATEIETEATETTTETSETTAAEEETTQTTFYNSWWDLHPEDKDAEVDEEELPDLSTILGGGSGISLMTTNTTKSKTTFTESSTTATYNSAYNDGKRSVVVNPGSKLATFYYARAFGDLDWGKKYNYTRTYWWDENATKSALVWGCMIRFKESKYWCNPCLISTVKAGEFYAYDKTIFHDGTYGDDACQKVNGEKTGWFVSKNTWTEVTYHEVTFYAWGAGLAQGTASAYGVNTSGTKTKYDTWYDTSLPWISKLKVDTPTVDYKGAVAVALDQILIKHTVTLNNQSATTAGTAKLGVFDNVAVYNNQSKYTGLMNDGKNTITKPTKTGYTFKGYYSAASGGTQYIDANGKLTSAGKTQAITKYADQTWYAQWTANTYTIAYNLQNGTYGSSHPTSATYNKSFTVNNPTRAGYTFTGWKITGMDTTCTHYYGSTSSSEKTTASSISSTKVTLYKNLRATSGTVTFKALWSANNYTITLNQDNATSKCRTTLYTTKDTDVYRDSARTEKMRTTYNGIEKPSRTGYTYNGFWSAKSGGTQYIDTISRITEAGLTAGKGYTANATWYAQWIPNKYTITLNGNGATTQNTATLYTTYDTNVFIDSGRTKGMANNANRLTIPVRTGYTFNGYYSATSGGTQYVYSHGQITNDGLTAGKKYTSTQTWYAKWTVNSYNYTVEDWFVDADNGRHLMLGSTTKTANYGTTVSGSVLGTDGSKSKYYSNYIYKSCTSAKQGTGSTVVYRYFWVWSDINTLYPDGTTQKSCDLEISYNGADYITADNEDYSKIVLPYGATIRIKDPAKPKYSYLVVTKYAVWSDEVTPTDGIYTVTITKYQRFAVYTRYSNYTVKFDSNTGEGTMSDMSFVYETAQNLSANTFTKTGYLFSGWNTEADGTGTSYADKASVKNLNAIDDGVTTLYAQWTPITYTIRYEKSTPAIIGTMEDTTCTYDTDTTLTSNSFTYKGFKFIGWDTDSSGTTVVYKDGDTVTNLTTTDGDIITLYPVFEAIPVTGVEIMDFAPLLAAVGCAVLLVGAVVLPRRKSKHN